MPGAESPPAEVSGAEGYVTELAYTPGYYAELDPRRLAARLTTLGLQAPKFARACELGCGQGVSLAVHAVAGDVEWWGNDLLPQHLVTVRSLTDGITDRAHVRAQSFKEFCDAEDLPTFDLVVMHGVWSWVSAENRRVILDFLARRLAPQAVVYLSYNTRAGWESVLPLRNFLVEQASRKEYAQLPLNERIEASLVAAQALVAADLPPASDNPQFEKQLRKIRHQAKSYLAHEYFNRDWQLFDPAEVADPFAKLGLRCLGEMPAGGEADGQASELRRFRRDIFARNLAPCIAARDEEGAVGGKFDRLADEQKYQRVRALNDRLLGLAHNEPHLSILASPRTGGGVEFGWRSLLALGAWRAGERDPGALAGRVAAALAAIGLPLVHHDTVIRDPIESRALLVREAMTFLEHTLPRLRELDIERY